MRPVRFIVLILLGIGFTVPVLGVETIRTDLRPDEAMPSITVAPDDWPWWRGPHLDGIARSQPTPLRWDDEALVRWRTRVEGRGHASPVVWGKQIYIATANEETEVQSLICFDRESGSKLWQTELHRGGFMEKNHRQNSHASATPACDGERIFTVFIHAGQLWTSAVSPSGNVLWQTPVGPYDAIYGFGSSPAIYGPLVIVLGDNDQTGAFMAALHRRTGRIVWRVERPKIDTYATPIVPHVGGRDQLLVAGGGWLTGYQPTTGEILWKCEGPTTETTANTVVFDSQCVYASGGYPKPYTMIAVDATGTGDVTETHLRWTLDRAMPYVTSPLLHDGLIYIADDWGIATCIDAETGDRVWQERLGGDFTSSPVLCGDRIFVVNEIGEVFVLAVGRESKLLAKSQLNAQVMATPTFCGGRVFVRTDHELICLEQPSTR